MSNNFAPLSPQLNELTLRNGWLMSASISLAISVVWCPGDPEYLLVQSCLVILSFLAMLNLCVTLSVLNFVSLLVRFSKLRNSLSSIFATFLMFNDVFVDRAHNFPLTEIDYDVLGVLVRPGCKLSSHSRSNSQ